MHAPTPPPDSTAPVQPFRELQVFTWSRCPVHHFLGVSVLHVKGSAPVCIPNEGTAHPVDPGELRTVAA